MVTGDATTSVVTHAWRVGSRLEEGLWFAPPRPMPQGIVQREGKEMARATRRQGGGQQRQRRSSRVRPAQLEVPVQLVKT